MRRHQRQTGAFDLSKSLSTCVWAVDDGIYRQLQAAGFELDVDDAVTRFDGFNRLGRVFNNVMHAFGKSAQERFDSRRVLFNHFGAGNDGVAIQLHTVVGVLQHHHVFGFDATRFDIEK